jgi:hypothetical protein
MKIISKILWIFLLVLFTQNILAQKFAATADRTTVGQNERFQVYFTFSGGDINKVKKFNSPDFKGFKVISGPNQSSSMQIINSQVSGSLEYSFIVVCSTIGDFTIGNSTIEYEGKKYTSQSLVIKVVKSGSKQGNTTVGGISDEELANNVFIRAIPNKTIVNKGEQVTITYKLYTRLNISSPKISKLPTYKNFWAEELETGNNIRFNVEMYNNELEVPVLIKRKRTSRDIFDDFFNDSFFGRTESVKFNAKSNIVKIKVNPLPVNNVPSSFNGAVGDFTFRADLDKKNVKQNEPISLKLSISGTGNIKLLDVPEVQLPPGFEKYEPKITESINRKDIVSGKKVVEYLIVPRVPGLKVIPQVEFSYYSSSRNRYVTLNSPKYEINITEGERTFESSISGYTKENVQLLSEDIRFIKTSAFSIRKKSEITIIQNWFWISLILPLIVLLTVLGYKKRHDKLSGNTKLLKYQKAEKAARSRLKSAKKAIENDDKAGFYNELSQALFGYLEDKLHLQKSEFSLERALTELNERSVSDKLIGKVRSIAEKCEFERFAPNSVNIEAEKDLYKETLKLIVGLDNSISSGKRKK